MPGPRGGRRGGEVVVAGTLERVLEPPDSLTARYLRGELRIPVPPRRRIPDPERELRVVGADRKSTRLNSSHSQISYAVFCLKKKNTNSIAELNALQSRLRNVSLLSAIH